VVIETRVSIVPKITGSAQPVDVGSATIGSPTFPTTKAERREATPSALERTYISFQRSPKTMVDREIKPSLRSNGANAQNHPPDHRGNKQSETVAWGAN
jgi:hypothetical protein